MPWQKMQFNNIQNQNVPKDKKTMDDGLIYLSDREIESSRKALKYTHGCMMGSTQRKAAQKAGYKSSIAITKPKPSQALTAMQKELAKQARDRQRRFAMMADLADVGYDEFKDIDNPTTHRLGMAAVALKATGEINKMTGGYEENQRRFDHELERHDPKQDEKSK